MNREEEIKLIAYNIWEQKGRPLGNDLRDWAHAEMIWEARQKMQKLKSTFSNTNIK